MSIITKAKKKKVNKGRLSWGTWYSEDNIKVVEGYCRDGLTDEQIAKNIGIHPSTIYSWKKDHPEFREAFKKGRAVTNVELENALFSKAVGARTKTVTYKMVKVDPDVLKARRAKYLEEYYDSHPGADKKEATLKAIEAVPTYERIAQTEVENWLPPDVGALMFLLKNRLPEKYREKSYQELNQAQALKAKVEAEIAKKQLDMLNQAEDPTNEQINDMLDKLAKEVSEDDGSK